MRAKVFRRGNLAFNSITRTVPAHGLSNSYDESLAPFSILRFDDRHGAYVVTHGVKTRSAF
jgi:hypothetical protein